MERVKYEIKSNIARITMDDGKAHAMNPDLFSGLGTAIDRCIEDDASVLIEGPLSCQRFSVTIPTYEEDLP